LHRRNTIRLCQIDRQIKQVKVEELDKLYAFYSWDMPAKWVLAQAK